MTPRERKLAITAGLAVGAVALYFTVHQFLLVPTAELENQIRNLHNKTYTFHKQIRKADTDRKIIRHAIRHSFDRQDERAAENARAMLHRMFKTAKLDGSLRLTPINGKRIANAYTERGWNIQASGPLDQLIDFLYLIEQDPHLHCIDQLTITPRLADGTARLNARYMTLIPAAIDPKTESLTPATQPAPSRATLTAGPRQQYDLIDRRDLFRPYIKRKPKPKPVNTTTLRHVRPAPDTPPPPRSDRFILVGLPTWAGQPEAILRDPLDNSTRTLHIGDSLLGGTITAIQYTQRPHPNKPGMLSGSRLVIRIQGRDMAVELGDALNQLDLLQPNTSHLQPHTLPAGDASHE